MKDRSVSGVGGSSNHIEKLYQNFFENQKQFHKQPKTNE